MTGLANELGTTPKRGRGGNGPERGERGEETTTYDTHTTTFIRLADRQSTQSEGGGKTRWRKGEVTDDHDQGRGGRDTGLR